MEVRQQDDYMGSSSPYERVALLAKAGVFGKPPCAGSLGTGRIYYQSRYRLRDDCECGSSGVSLKHVPLWRF